MVSNRFNAPVFNIFSIGLLGIVFGKYGILLPFGEYVVLLSFMEPLVKLSVIMVKLFFATILDGVEVDNNILYDS